MNVINGSNYLKWDEALRKSGYSSLVDVPLDVSRNFEAMAKNLFRPVRDRFDQPLIVVSGIRSNAMNKKARGARRSRHVVGDAIDVRPVDRWMCLLLYNVISSLMTSGDVPPGGLCLYREGSKMDPGPPRFVHMDSRGRKARWHVLHDERWTSFRKDLVA